MTTRTTNNARPKRKAPTPRAVATALRVQGARNGYSITVEERDRRLDDQWHRCAVCWRPFRVPAWHQVCTFIDKITGRRIRTSPAVDHDHKSGLVRGLLCRNCNRYVVTMVEKYPEWVAAAQLYVYFGGFNEVYVADRFRSATMRPDVSPIEGATEP